MPTATLDFAHGFLWGYVGATLTFLLLVHVHVRHTPPSDATEPSDGR
jgi:hypothetical protein